MLNLKERARIISEALKAAGIPHAIVGGLAVAAYVSRVDPFAERGTKDVDLLLSRDDLDRAAKALQPHGYRLRKVLGIYAFTKAGKGAKFRDAVHVVKAGEKVREEYLHPAPVPPMDTAFYADEGYSCIDLADLLKMKLTSFRLKDQVHVQDLILAGLVTGKVERAIPGDLLERLEQIKEVTKRERLT